MGVDYDPAKAAGNLRKHKVSFADAEGVLRDPRALTVEDPDSAGEQRFVCVDDDGLGRILVVVYALHAETVRLISVRRASRGERVAYEK